MTRNKLTCALILLATSTTAVYAGETTWFGDNAADGQWLAGIKTGATEAGLDGYTEVNSTTLVVGYQFSRPIGESGSSSIEFEFGGSNDADIGRSVIGGRIGRWDYDSTALFFNYRSAGTVYYKGKFGILDSNITSKFGNGTSEEINDTFFAYGLGAGIRLGNEDQRFNLEAEWVGTAGESDINAFTIGVLVQF